MTIDPRIRTVLTLSALGLAGVGVAGHFILLDAFEAGYTWPGWRWERHSLVEVDQMSLHWLPALACGGMLAAAVATRWSRDRADGLFVVSWLTLLAEMAWTVWGVMYTHWPLEPQIALDLCQAIPLFLGVHGVLCSTPFVGVCAWRRRWPAGALSIAGGLASVVMLGVFVVLVAVTPPRADRPFGPRWWVSHEPDAINGMPAARWRALDGASRQRWRRPRARAMREQLRAQVRFLHGRELADAELADVVQEYQRDALREVLEAAR